MRRDDGAAADHHSTGRGTDAAVQKWQCGRNRRDAGKTERPINGRRLGGTSCRRDAAAPIVSRPSHSIHSGRAGFYSPADGRVAQGLSPSAIVFYLMLVRGPVRSSSRRRWPWGVAADSGRALNRARPAETKGEGGEAPKNVRDGRQGREPSDNGARPRF